MFNLAGVKRGGMWIHWGVISLFLSLGIIFNMGKGAGLIAGFNTMSRKQKAEYDRLCDLCKYRKSV